MSERGSDYITELQEEIERQHAELTALRLIVTEKFARDIEVAVKPEDAADVAKWAANPEAVRELLKLQPYRAVMDEPYLDDDDQCSGCEARAADAHLPDCRVFLAWAALDDPRASEAIGAAFDRARPPPPYVGGWVGVALNDAPADGEVLVRLGPPGSPFRLASESEQAARARMLIGSIYGRHVAGCCLHVVLDDENLEDSAVAVCVEAAEREGHEDCRELARMLSAMSVEQRSLVTAVPV